MKFFFKMLFYPYSTTSFLVADPVGPLRRTR